MSGEVVLAVALAMVAVPQRTASADCATEAARLRTHLTAEADPVHRWNFSWAMVFGGAAITSFVLAGTHTNPFGPADTNYEETMYVGGAKATVGALARIVMPLRVVVPRPDPDACADLANVRGAVRDIARREKRTFWLTHLGGFAVNLTGAIILWHRRSFRVGAVSFLLSFPVGPLSAYTMPRSSWHLYREESPAWAVATELGAGSR